MPEATALPATQPLLEHTAFYRFVALPDPAAVAAVLRELAGRPPGLTGSILVAAEGINGMLAGPPGALHALERALQTDPRLTGAFAGMNFKRSACSSVPFHRLKVHVKPEIVPMGIAGVDATGPSGTHLSPQAWRAFIRQPDVVLLDNRNSFEYRLGRFAGAVDPQVRHFRDFPAFVLAHLDAWKASGQRVGMYCTGGIRCEKTGAWMEQLGLPVVQLAGGILNYFREMPDAQADWEGECFVFDNRVALDTRLQETATTLEDVYRHEPDGAWRLARARRLDAAGDAAGDTSAPAGP